MDKDFNIDNLLDGPMGEAVQPLLDDMLMGKRDYHEAMNEVANSLTPQQVGPTRKDTLKNVANEIAEWLAKFAEANEVPNFYMMVVARIEAARSVEEAETKALSVINQTDDYVIPNTPKVEPEPEPEPEYTLYKHPWVPMAGSKLERCSFVANGVRCGEPANGARHAIGWGGESA